MTEENINPTVNDSGGASGSQPQSAPQLVSAFSFPAEGGDIHVYLFKGGFSKYAVLAFDDTHAEFAYAVQTITSNPTKEAYELVESAEKAFSDPFISNPFSQLLKNSEAMTKLIIIFRNFLSGE